MNKTAMQELVDELQQSIDHPEHPFYTFDVRQGLKMVLMFITTDFFGDSLLLKERQQIIEAAKNFSNSPGEAENYFNITYGNENNT